MTRKDDRGRGKYGRSGRAGRAGRAGSLVKDYLANALAPNTVSAYLSDLRHFRNWGGRIPATPEMVARYVADCGSTLKASTLTRRLAAISSAHLAIAKKSPTDSGVVRRTMRGIRRVHGAAVKQAAPVTIPMLRAMACPSSDVMPLRDLRDRALLLLGFAGGFRRSELVSLKPTDLRFTREGLIVNLQRSKTDPHAKGRAVAIPSGRGRLCPVGPLLRWLHVLRAHDEEGSGKALFRRVDRYGNLGGALGAGSVGGIVRQRLRLCGFEARGFSSHSLRAGLVTAAAAAGLPTWAIQRQTGHKSERTVHRYIRGLAPFERNAFGLVAG
jgi:integrase